jgi:ATP-dependent DNA helicase RecG
MYSEGGVVYFHKEVVREILLNAIVHQDYSSCNPIQNSVYEDKMYIWNEGEIPPNLDSADKLFMKHSSKPHNPNWANIFFKSGMNFRDAAIEKVLFSFDGSEI